MQPRKKLFRRINLLVLCATTLLLSMTAPMLYHQEAMQQTVAQATPAEIAKNADSFVDSIGVVTHWGYTDTPYSTNYQDVKQKLVNVGIRHVRDGGSSADVIAKMKDLAASGIKTTFVLDPNGGTTPNSSYWVNSPGYNIHDFVLNTVGTNVIEAVEILNEIDVFYNNYYWHPGDTAKINNDPTSPLYWVPYVQSITKDTFTALKSDPATAQIKVIGPSLGVTYDYTKKSPLGDLSTSVDWGNFHPYPGGGNSFSFPFSYDTIDKYFWQGNFPSVNIDENPYAFDVYSPPFGTKPMAATETGYNTSSSSISDKVHGKYMPRLFLEYFRKGIARTFSYEFVDEFNDPTNGEANYGLLHHDLTPKPAYVALQNLISLLQDPGPTFTPGTLNYSFTMTPPPGYNRTQYIHHLLLQKRDGSFYLALWHDISNSDRSTKPIREITPPPVPTTVTFNQLLKSATLYTLDDQGNISSTAASATAPLNLNIGDQVVIVKILPA